MRETEPRISHHPGLIIWWWSQHSKSSHREQVPNASDFQLSGYIMLAISSHWPKQVTWPRPESSQGKTTQGFDVGRCKKNEGPLLRPPSCNLDPAGRSRGKNGEKWMDFYYT